MIAAVPAAPRQLAMPDDAETIFGVLAAVLLVVALVFGIRLLITRRDPLLLLCLLGGAFCSLVEPFIGVLGLMYIPQEDASVAFTFFDRGMPWFVVTSYAGYIGGLAYLAYRWFEQGGITPKRVLQIWIVFAVANVAFETPAVVLDAYSYYGQQPLNPWGFPLWWAFVNPLTSIIAGALLFRLRDPLARHRALFVVPLLVPLGAGSANGTTAPPMWLTLNDDGLAHVWTWVASGMTLALALLVVWMLGTLLGDRQDPAPPPGRRASREDEPATVSA